MSTSTVTEPQVTEAVEAAVAERGADYIYPLRTDPAFSLHGSCLYAVETESGLAPGCIVGDVFNRLGIATPDRMRDFDLRVHNNFNIEADSSVGSLVEDLALDLPPRVLEALSAAQTEQDFGKDWGTALHVYRRTLAEETDA